VLVLILFLLGTAAFSYGLVTAIASEIPTLDPARYHREQNSYIYAGNGQILAILRGSENRKVVASDQIADVMKQAIVAVEDKRFFEHRGIDLHGILRALWADVTNQKVVQGGSTITQQFVKNAFTGQQRSFGRKLKEAALAWQLEQQWSKDRILTAYLNTIYFGNGAYGIEQAAQVYFGKTALTLTLSQAALLAGIPSDPTLYDPVTHPRLARERRARVLRDMLAEQDITYAQYRVALAAPLPPPEDVHLPGSQGPAPYFTNYVKQLLVDRYGTGRVFGGGLQVHTSIDLNLQDIARQAISQWLPSDSGPAAALVAIDPRDGRVLAMFGGRNFHESQFNLAVQGERQPGSAFKPFALAAALQQGISPSTTFVSHPVRITLDTGKIWYVHNYEGSNLGTIDLESATIHSDNTVYAQLAKVVGPQAIANSAHELGITSRLDPYFSIVLGGEAVNPLEMARAYSSFADGGQRIDGSIFRNHPRAILSVNGEANAPVPYRALGANDAAIVNRFLQEVVLEGTGVRAQLSDGRPVAGKTGTTENYGDAWFVGYTPQLAVSVWVGYPNRLRPMTTEFNGQPVAGGTYPALIFKTFMEKALAYLGDQPEAFAAPTFPAPVTERVVLRDGVWQRDNGQCKGTVSLVFFSDEVPSRLADCRPNEVDVPNVLGLDFDDATATLSSQPLKAQAIYKPANPGQRVGVVVGEIPSAGSHLSALDTVRLVLAKPLHGVVPDVVGQAESAALARLTDRGLKPDVVGILAGAGTGEHVISQHPAAGVAAAPGMKVTLVVGT
jgi:penicillin-binding protein 1A